MNRNLHNKPFDECTLKKLEIFELYTKEWLPTFIMSRAKAIYIFDFFAGTGYDKKNKPGSSIRILKNVKGQLNNIYKNGTKVNLVFNELDKNKFAQLKEACDDFVDSDDGLKKAKSDGMLSYKVLQEDFSTLFPKQIAYIEKFPSLVFLDQNGVKYLADPFFQPLVRSRNTDFLYFVSSSYVMRFGDTKEFSQSISYDKDRAEKEPSTWIHRNVLDELRKRIPKGNKTKLYPFSLKKGANVYGIVFGASHPRAVDKFLSMAWKENETNGEANFDIDDDKSKGTPDLFGYKALTKIEKFQQALRKNLLEGKLLTNQDVYNYTMENGHLPRHAAEEINRMRNENLLSYDGRSPLVTYEQVYRLKRIIPYTVRRK